MECPSKLSMCYVSSWLQLSINTMWCFHALRFHLRRPMSLLECLTHRMSSMVSVWWLFFHILKHNIHYQNGMPQLCSGNTGEILQTFVILKRFFEFSQSLWACCLLYIIRSIAEWGMTPAYVQIIHINYCVQKIHTSRQVLISLYGKPLIFFNFTMTSTTCLKPRFYFCWQNLREMLKHIISILLILKTCL